MSTRLESQVALLCVAQGCPVMSCMTISLFCRPNTRTRCTLPWWNPSWPWLLLSSDSQTPPAGKGTCTLPSRQSITYQTASTTYSGRQSGMPPASFNVSSKHAIAPKDQLCAVLSSSCRWCCSGTCFTLQQIMHTCM